MIIIRLQKRIMRMLLNLKETEIYNTGFNFLNVHCSILFQPLKMQNIHSQQNLRTYPKILRQQKSQKSLLSVELIRIHPRSPRKQNQPIQVRTRNSKYESLKKLIKNCMILKNEIRNNRINIGGNLCLSVVNKSQIKISLNLLAYV